MERLRDVSMQVKNTDKHWIDCLKINCVKKINKENRVTMNYNYLERSKFLNLLLFQDYSSNILKGLLKMGACTALQKIY